MAALITAIINLLILVFKGWSEWDAEKRKKNEELRVGWKEAAKSRNLSVINGYIDRLRK